MKNRRTSKIVIAIVLAAFIVTGCAGAKTDLCPTVEPLSCPTNAPLSCPTSAPLSCQTTEVQGPAAPNEWRDGYNGDANVVITFDPGDKCSMEVKNPVTSPNWAYEINVNDKTYQNYVVTVLFLDEGKTLKDLQDYHEANPTSTTPPPFSKVPMVEIVQPLSSTWHGITLAGSQVYFVCIVQGPDDQRVIDEFGPVKITE